MNRVDGYQRIEVLESGIARHVMQGQIELARDLALAVAQVRDSMLTTAELTAAIEVRLA